MTDVSAKVIEDNEITPQSNYVWIRHDGRCVWEPRFELSATDCNVDVTWFPFDSQKCQLIFESWVLSSDQLNITTPDDADALDDYEPSEEWNLIGGCMEWTTLEVM